MVFMRWHTNVVGCCTGHTLWKSADDRMGCGDREKSTAGHYSLLDSALCRFVRCCLPRLRIRRFSLASNCSTA
jgi:hypothetical protein